MITTTKADVRALLMLSSGSWMLWTSISLLPGLCSRSI